MRHLIPILAALAVACGGDCASIDEITLRGGDATQRATVRAALDDFAGWSARDTVCVDAITLTDTIPAEDDLEVLGRYDPAHGEIALVADHPALYHVALHELCHALQEVDDLVDRDPTAFTLDGAFYGGLEDDWSERLEAFALDCEVGPELLAVGRVAADACGRPSVLDTFDVLLDLAYPAYTAPVPRVPTVRRPAGEAAFPEGFEIAPILPIAASTNDTMLVFGLVDAVPTVMQVDIGVGVDAGPVELAPLPPLPDGTPDRRLFVAGAAEQAGATWAAFHWRVSSGEILRFLAVHDGERWALPDDPCLAPGSWVIPLGGQPYVVTLEDEVVRWSELRTDAIAGR